MPFPNRPDQSSAVISDRLKKYGSPYYSSYLMFPKYEINEATALDLLKNSKISVFMGHGNSSSINLESSGAIDLSISGMNSLGTGGLNGVNLVLFMGCSTAENQSSNLPMTARSLGATCAVGFTNTIYDYQLTPTIPQSWMTIYLNKFFECLIDGEDVQWIMNQAYYAVPRVLGVIPGVTQYAGYNTNVTYGNFGF